MPKANESSDKLKFHLLPSLPLREVVKVLQAGAKKYGERDYLRAGPLIIVNWYDALQRHAWEWATGRRRDPDSGFHSMAAVAAEALIIMDLEHCHKIEPLRTDRVEQKDLVAGHVLEGYAEVTTVTEDADGYRVFKRA